MKQIATVLLVSVLALLSAPRAHALAILIEPPAGQVLKIHPGETIRVDINVVGLHAPVADTDLPPGTVSGAGPFRADSFLAAFNFDFEFDENVLVFALGGSSPGTALGAPSQGESLYELTRPSAGIIRLLGVSLLEESSNTCMSCLPPYLDVLQSDGTGAPIDKLRLATLAFYLPVGQGPLAETTLFKVSDIVLSDSLGNEIPLLDANGNAVFNASGDPITGTSDSITGFVRSDRVSVFVPEPGPLDLLLIGALGWRLSTLARRSSRAGRQSRFETCLPASFDRGCSSRGKSG